MPFHRLLKISILVLMVATTGLVWLPPKANAQNTITCTAPQECQVCHDECQDGFICYAEVCENGSASGCFPCAETKKHPLDFQKRIRSSDDKALLAQLLSNDLEISQALRSLK